MHLREFTKVLEIFTKILKKITEQPGKRLNLDKFVTLLNTRIDLAGISIEDVKEMITVFLEAQQSFKDQDLKHRFVSEGEHDYLTFNVRNEDELPRDDLGREGPLKINLTEEEIKQISDIVQVHLFVNKGRGFDLKSEQNARIVRKAWEMKEKHPELFYVEGNFLYPESKLFQFAKRLNEYSRASKRVPSIQVDNIKFILT